MIFKEKEVDAIEDGKIVRVSEKYARREGLPIVRTHGQAVENEKKENVEQRKRENKGSFIGFDEFRKPLNWKKSQVELELVDNFHWEISKRRKEMGLSRRQVAKAVEESEETLKHLENGVLPTDDFLLINKLQRFLNINLRADKKDFNQNMRKIVDNNQKTGRKADGEQEQEESVYDELDDMLSGDEVVLDEENL